MNATIFFPEMHLKKTEKKTFSSNQFQSLHLKDRNGQLTNLTKWPLSNPNIELNGLHCLMLKSGNNNNGSVKHLKKRQSVVIP